MASQALYRRYRSQTFDELIGQEHVVQTLRNALAEGRIAHAYLFTGPRGVGKTSVARLLAKAVNCTAPLPERPCGHCDSCVSVAEGRAVDVIEMDAASHTSVEDAREIIEKVQFRPTIGPYKVYIIDEVHMLSNAAFNALLKTLEEPPGHALFILATTEVHKVPKTILSRCQQFVFSRHTVSSISAHLRQIAADEGFALEEGVPELIARASTGSMRDALSLLDQLMAYGGQTIRLDQVQALIGATSSRDVTALVEALTSADLSAALRGIAAASDSGADLRQFARDTTERLRALLLLKASGDADLLDLTEDEAQVLGTQAAAVDLGALVRWVKLFSALDPQIRAATVPQLPLELAAVEALTAPSTLAVMPAPRPGVAPPPRPAAPAGPGASRPGEPTWSPPAAARPATPKPASIAPEPQASDPLSPSAAAALAPEPQASAAPLPPSNAAARVPEPQASAALEPQTSVAPKPQASAPLPPSGAAASAPERAATSAAPEPQASAPEPQASAPEPQASATYAAENAAAAVMEQVEQVWPAVVRDVRVVDKTLQALLNSGVKPVDVRGSIVMLEVASEWLQKKIEALQARQVIEKILSKHMGANYGIACVFESQNHESPNKLRDEIRNARKDPLVKAAINIFDAEVIGVEHQE